MIALTDQPINTEEIIATVQSDGAGAINVFIGTVRNNTQKKTVVRLEFEAYESMALKKMQELADLASERWPVQKVAIVHRTGLLPIGEAAVVIAVSTPHRKASFEACEFIIDTLKEIVPIWKKEIFEDGEVWVAAHP
ncbi:molybdenum cofactor biosynthesis protein MoaE [Adhaeribacter radiodurans]|uniref:Molybdopterin synthase catalytic subunit n=1 Tax=Adhaeribacter radiodurans TaxID=2745197 RepID=A0A7L7L3J4_9BACT|nr:molybdenum cofactor biosynthesis protein MoaE [Adhaeribacter radiodurans]QMU27155.1 molybdenum cofactor biosynthesis protein MoaE [Adhaeribacter radiodurans]